MRTPNPATIQRRVAECKPSEQKAEKKQTNNRDKTISYIMRGRHRP